MDNITKNSNKKREIINRYNSSSAFYDKRYKAIQKKKFHIIFNNYDINDKIILDLGCGTGLLYEYFKELNEESDSNLYFYVAVDISKKMLLEFKSKNSNLKDNKRLTIILADIENLPLKEDIFDSNFSLTSFQNLPNLNQGIKESIRVSKKKSDFKFSILKKKLNLKTLLDFLNPLVKVESVREREDLEDIILQGQIFKE